MNSRASRRIGPEKNDQYFELGGAYNFTDNLATSFGLQWAGVGYDATGTPRFDVFNLDFGWIF